MIDPSTALAAYEGIRFAKDALTTLVKGKVEIESQGQVYAALEQLGKAQDSLFALREELLALQNENSKLRATINEQNDWAEKKRGYELTETAGGAVVLRDAGPPEHYACPSCVNKREIQILQDLHNMSGQFMCPGCKVPFPIRRSSNPML